MASKRAAEKRGELGSAKLANVTGKNDRSSWATLTRCLHGRTLHVNALSPLHLHNSRSDDDDGETLSSKDLDHAADKLFTFLLARLGDPVYASTSLSVSHQGSSDGREVPRQATLSRGLVRSVKAGFLQIPRDADLADKGRRRTDEAHFWGSALQPWAIEIELKPPASDSMQGEDEDEPRRGKARSKVERAHLVFLSSSRRLSDLHYPIVLWKAPTAKVFTAAATEAQDGDEEGEDAIYQQQQLSSRLFTSHVLDFIGRYFDCRLSPLPPLAALRGKGLESLTEHILQQARADAASGSHDTTSSFPIELTYSLPRMMRQDEDEDGDASDADEDGTLPSALQLLDALKRPLGAHNGIDARRRKRQRKDMQPGPAPELDTLSLSIPPAVAHALVLHGARDDSEILPVVTDYLAEHTSLQLSRMALVRSGAAGVYIGTPASSSAAGGGGEVRLKFSQNGGDTTGSADDDADSKVEAQIGTTLRHLMTLIDGTQ